MEEFNNLNAYELSETRTPTGRPCEFDVNDPRRFDRLVDGELTDTQIQSLLSGLDDVEDGWRRCALAFVERQMWERDLAGWMDQPAPKPPAKPQPPAAEPAPQQQTPGWYLPVAMAASMLLAFFGSQAWQQWSQHAPQDNSIPIVNKQDSKPSGPVDIREVSDSPAGRLTLTLDRGNSGEHNVEIPFYDGKQIDKKTLAKFQQNVIPPAVENRLRKQGHRIVRETQLLEVQLDNGKHVVIPVEQVEVVPIRPPIQ